MHASKVIVCVLVLAFQAQLRADRPLRIVSIGGTVSEIVCALGSCEQIVATDSSSLFPESLKALPQLGYSRALSVESILSHQPELLLLSEEAGPRGALDKLKLFKGTQLNIQNQPTVAAARQRIVQIGKILGKEAASEKIVQQLDHELKGIPPPPPTRLRVLFLYARGSKVLMVAGRESSAAAMIEVAGGERVGGDFTGYKPLNPEAIAAAAPDLILMTQAGLASIGGEKALWLLPGFRFTPAFQKKRLLVMEDLYLLGMGPRMGLAAQELAKAFQNVDLSLSSSERKR